MNNQAAKIISRVVLSPKTLNIKLLGDSITHGMGGTGFEPDGELIIEKSWATWNKNTKGHCWANSFKEYMESNFNCKVNNNACSGTDINFINYNFDTLVDTTDDIIICTIGTNNRSQWFNEGPRRTKEEHLKNVYNGIVELNNKFKALKKDVIFIANIPASLKEEQDGEEFWRICHMNDINNLYLKASVECDFPLISLYNDFSKYCFLTNTQVDTLLRDGLHPNDKGYDVMFRLILNELGLADIPY